MTFENGIYYSLSDFLKQKFGTKTVKLSIDAGFTCPNRDGLKGIGGCIFCGGKGSGDFAGDRVLSIKEQIESQKKLISKKWPSAKYIAYFQAFSNTYASAEILTHKYSEALLCSDIVALAIATRPDCIENEVLDVLKSFAEKTYLWVELGLQTSNEETGRFLNRRYTNADFKKAVNILNTAGIDTVAHIIVGLPGESREDIINSVKFALSCGINGIKLHMLHVIKDTALYEIYKDKPFNIMTLDEYTDTIVEILRIIPPDIVIHRLTGDGPKDITVAPIWSFNKRNVLNLIGKKMRAEGFKQGDLT